MRMVLDCDVLVAALRSDQGASRQLVLAAFDKQYQLLLSVPVVIEYEAVLTRTEHLEAADLSAEDVGRILDGLVAVGEAVRLSFRWRPILTDPEDDMVLETAVNGRADLLVTFNQRHFADGAGQFGVEVASPAEALARLRKQS
ncbi:MAG: putative toxin-antitoxin system toxin component, PIN family [Gemmatimonadetes bacterium]|nr:putative toxin-antitoxin system toxin component, PIN family [Gemmatimonadota bacterium]